MAFAHLEDNLHSEDRGEPDVKIPEDLVAGQGSVREGAGQGRHRYLHHHTTVTVKTTPTPLPPSPQHHHHHHTTITVKTTTIPTIITAKTQHPEPL